MTGREPPMQASRETRDAIHQEHESLRAMLRRIEGTQQLADLVPLMTQLLQALEEHFATEERPDGLHAAIQDREPRYGRALHVILDEHREFLALAREILARARTCLEQKEVVLRDVLRLANRLHDHEARETELLTDTFNTDLGGRSD
jgi:hypothetical protein